ncbi:hypothetical protein HYS82_01740 [Candidatus Amesbacteria bacterium]|nr:hypothetical protein [Candidatus Amesbacteria bacterium]MBI2587372.1 hypothetical protein [Candidatus Amesbacteria bacterium]
MKKPIKSIFRNRNSEAAFWEKNINQIWRKGKPVRIRFAKNLSETINIRFDPRSMKALRNRAQERGLGATQLIRMWTMEKLHSV